MKGITERQKRREEKSKTKEIVYQKASKSVIPINENGLRSPIKTEIIMLDFFKSI